MKIIVSILAIFVTTAAAGITRYRLPKTVVPNFYNITTYVDLDFLTFQGYTEIRVHVLEETKNITLHALELTVLDINVISLEDDDETIKIANTIFDEEREFLILRFEEQLETGQYQIEVSYQGILNEHVKGFFRSNYSNEDFLLRHMAMTQFETTDARRAFPCFDEPALKAHFSISLVRDEEYHSVSNMPLMETVELIDGRFRDTFETSPRMSTYLVAFAVSDFSNISYPRGHIFARPALIDRAFFAAEISSPVLSALESYLQMEFPLKKLDQIAMVHFGGGAMENWGLIGYLESKLLYEEGKSRRSAKQALLMIVAHECAHQWFGDLVSPEWWNYIWLNEGLSRLMQYLIADKVIPEWRLTEQFMSIGMREAFEADHEESSRAMTTNIAEKLSDYDKFFDKITYEKAASVLLTLHNALGEDIFRACLQSYVKENQYSTVTGKDLWAAFDKYNSNRSLMNGLNITTVMESWEFQAGYPVVNVIIDYASGSVQFSQERFLLNSKIHGLDTKWYIPINFATMTDPDFNNTKAAAWLTPSSNITLSQYLKQREWLIVNKQASFYYRVNYDKRNWKRIASALNSENFGNIPPLTRSKLLSDAFVLARSGRLNYSVALEMIKYLHRETDYIPLNSFFHAFDFFYKRFYGLQHFNLLQGNLSQMLQPVLEHLGFEENENITGDKEHIDILNRIQIIQWSCLLGNELCRNMTTEKLKNISSISADLKEVIVCGGLREADFALWLELYAACLQGDDPEIEKALGCSEDKNILEFFLSETLQRNISVFSHIYLRGIFGINFALDYLVEHLNEIYESLSASETSAVIAGLSNKLFANEQLLKLQALSSNSTFPELEDAFSTAISKVKTNVDWANLYADDIEFWIKKKLSSHEEDDYESSASILTLNAFPIFLVYAFNVSL